MSASKQPAGTSFHDAALQRRWGICLRGRSMTSARYGAAAPSARPRVLWLTTLNNGQRPDQGAAAPPRERRLVRPGCPQQVHRLRVRLRAGTAKRCARVARLDNRFMRSETVPKRARRCRTRHNRNLNRQHVLLTGPARHWQANARKVVITIPSRLEQASQAGPTGYIAIAEMSETAGNGPARVDGRRYPAAKPGHCASANSRARSRAASSFPRQMRLLG